MPLLLTDAGLWYLCIFGYALAVAIAVAKANKDINWFKGAALSILMSYGGGTMVPILLGIPGVLVQNEVAIPAALVAWTVASSSMFDSLARTAWKTSPMLWYASMAAMSIAYEVFRCQVMMGCAAMAVNTLKPPKSYPVATVGPLLCGMLGGIGGGFMPLSVGLEPITGGLNWRIRSAFFFSVWMRMLLDPTTSPYLVGVMPALANAAAGRAMGIAVMAAVPLVSMAMPSFQPLGKNPIVDMVAAKQKSD
jgi:hypothetical protein